MQTNLEEAIKHSGVRRSEIRPLKLYEISLAEVLEDLTKVAEATW